MMAVQTILILLLVIDGSYLVYHNLKRHNLIGMVKARYAITLKGGEGEFVGLLTEKRWDRLTFENCTVPPVKRSEAPQDVPGKLVVARADIAYLQELPNDHI